MVADRILAHLEADAPARQETFTVPTAWLGEAVDAEAAIDLREDRGVLAALGVGWSEWHPQWSGRAALSPVAEVLLPARPGDLVLRGSLPEGAPLPQRIHFGINNVRVEAFDLPSTGPFELRVPQPIPASYLPPRYEGYAPVVLHSDRAWSLGHGDSRRMMAVVHEIAFE